MILLLLLHVRNLHFFFLFSLFTGHVYLIYLPFRALFTNYLNIHFIVFIALIVLIERIFFVIVSYSFLLLREVVLVTIMLVVVSLAHFNYYILYVQAK